MMMLLRSLCEQILNKVLIGLGAGECGFSQTEEQTISKFINTNGVFIVKKLFAILVVSLMTISSFAKAGDCGGEANYDHDAKKKMEKGA